MNIAELKEQILNQQLNDDFIVFVCKQNTFLAEQYVDAICDYKLLDRNNINSLEDIKPDSALSLVFDYHAQLNVLKTDTFSEFINNYEDYSNTIVICKDVDKKIKDSLAEYIIETPELLDWQVIDYMQVICDGLPIEDYKWLYEASNKNIYRIINELDKVKLFDISERHNILMQLKYEANTDLYSINNFTLADAILKRDYSTIKQALQHRSCFQVKEASGNKAINLYGLLTALINKMRLLLFKYGNGMSDEAMLAAGLIKSKGSLYYLKDFAKIPQDWLKNKLNFLTELDIRIKSGDLRLDSGSNKSDDKFIDYLLVNLL